MGKDKKKKEKETPEVEEVDGSISDEYVDRISERKHQKKSKDRHPSKTHEDETEKIEDGEETSKKKKKKKEKKHRSDSESPESAEPTVHSFNDWEHANLGDDQRKDKFLKLMGAKKTEHTGKIVIGEPAAVENQHKADDPNLNKKLEDQFTQGLEHKLKSGWKGHLGLGCNDEESTAAEGKKRKDEGGDISPSSNDPPTAKKKFMMSFVKSSDS